MEIIIRVSIFKSSRGERMQLGFEAILLFAVGFMDNKMRSLTKNEFSDAIGISRSTFNRHIKKLEISKFVEETEIGSMGYELTPRGRKKYDRIRKDAVDIYLIPDRHGTGSVISFKSIIEYISDPLVILKIVSHTHLGKDIDVVEILQRYTALKEGSRYLTLIDEVLSIDVDKDTRYPDEIILSTTSIGIRDFNGELSNQNMDRYRSILAMTEFKFRSGHLDEASSTYHHILQSLPGLPQNIWIMAFVRYLKCLMGKGNHELVLETTEKIVPLLDNVVHKAMIKQVRADDLSFLGRHEQAERIYRYCSGVYYKKELPILQSTLKNNLGVMYFRLGKYDLAESSWREGKRIARKNDLLWVNAVLDMNIGDLLVYKKKRIKRGKDLIRNARKVMERLNDLEGIADAHFNYSLACIEEGNLKLAERHFRRSMEFPIRDEVRRNERISVFNGRMEGKGK